ncbi:MAG TPA: hypothetical protein VLY63_27090 [Anaerolineae bacterium]|nr:hypothetical protein [Anaerolineae bacterium]
MWDDGIGSHERKTIRIRVTVHGMLTAAVDDPSGILDIVVPEGTDVQGLVEILSERSPLFDPRACFGLIDGARVPGDMLLRDGQQVNLYLMFGGGY